MSAECVSAAEWADTIGVARSGNGMLAVFESNTRSWVVGAARILLDRSTIAHMAAPRLYNFEASSMLLSLRQLAHSRKQAIESFVIVGSVLRLALGMPAAPRSLAILTADCTAWAESWVPCFGLSDPSLLLDAELSFTHDGLRYASAAGLRLLESAGISSFGDGSLLRDVEAHMASHANTLQLDGDVRWDVQPRRGVIVGQVKVLVKPTTTCLSFPSKTNPLVAASGHRHGRWPCANEVDRSSRIWPAALICYN